MKKWKSIHKRDGVRVGALVLRLVGDYTEISGRGKFVKGILHFALRTDESNENKHMRMIMDQDVVESIQRSREREHSVWSDEDKRIAEETDLGLGKRRKIIETVVCLAQRAS
ncbi:hypothetical protein V1477_012419 [Vespula maculifrons]|uniref:Uncharacterized protein n=1 Tax=Vespula maculifrons TaxID=7453 RepID=A0ABD2BYZ9_VESMC